MAAETQTKVYRNGPHGDIQWKELAKPVNREKMLEYKRWLQNESYKKKHPDKAAAREAVKQSSGNGSNGHAKETAKPQPKRFSDDSAEFYKLLKQTPLSEPFREAKPDTDPGFKRSGPTQQAAEPEIEYDEDGDPIEPEPATGSNRGDQGYKHDDIDDAKAHLFVRLSNFAAALTAKVIYNTIGFDVDMEAMKLDVKDVDSMAEDSKWFIQDIGITPKQMFAFNLLGTVTMNGFYSAKKTTPWWKEWMDKNKDGNNTNEARPFNGNDSNDFQEAEII